MDQTINDLVELNERQAAKFIGVEPGTLNKWRCRKKGPPYYKLAGKVRYKRAEFVQWIESCRVDPRTTKSERRRSRAA
jgi:hypothetical protein